MPRVYNSFRTENGRCTQRSSRSGLRCSRTGSGDNLKGYWAEGVGGAAGSALADRAAPVHAEAAEALGFCPQFGRMAKGELNTALKDTDPTVRLCARALLHVEDKSPAAALRYLSDMLTDPTPLSDRSGCQ